MVYKTSSGTDREPSSSNSTNEDTAKLVMVAAGSLVAGAGLFWAGKQIVDYYVPYQVR